MQWYRDVLKTLCFCAVLSVFEHFAKRASCVQWEIGCVFNEKYLFFVCFQKIQLVLSDKSLENVIFSKTLKIPKNPTYVHR